MKRRSRAGREPIKGQRRKTPEPTSGSGPNAPAGAHSSSGREEREVARIIRERDEALQQQTATSEVLRVISASRGELEPVFKAMLERAIRLCEAKFGALYRFDGNAFHLVRSRRGPFLLQVISGSAGDVQPVFEAVLANAARLCDAKFGTINRWDGEALHLVATYNVPLAFAKFRRSNLFRPGPENPISRMLLDLDNWIDSLKSASNEDPTDAIIDRLA